MIAMRNPVQCPVPCDGLHCHGSGRLTEVRGRGVLPPIDMDRIIPGREQCPVDGTVLSVPT